jgi:CRP-like cAMP-binding protein
LETSGALGKIYKDGEAIIHQGDMGDCMFVIQEGQIEVILEKDGKEVKLATRGAGEFFGEMALFEKAMECMIQAVKIVYELSESKIIPKMWELGAW